MSVAPLARADTDGLRALFEQHAALPGDRSPLYAAISRAVASDDETLALMLCAPPLQRRPTLLLAAIHDLLLAGAEHELAAHVPTVAAGRAQVGSSGPPAPGHDAAASSVGPLALKFCREHRDALAHILATRSTQTNEVNRAAALLPALVHAAPAGRPLRLVELGASAGLNLLFDRFAYRYGGGPVVHGRAALSTQPQVVCECAVEGSLPDLDTTPVVVERVGVDLEPVDVRDARARRWLLACVRPDEPDRVRRLRAAIELALRDPPPVVRGDALALLPELVDGSAGAHPVIWHSWVLAYWPAERQRALTATIDALGARRDLTWTYLEQADETPGLPTPVGGDRRSAALVAVTYRAGERTLQRVADASDHLHEMRWLAGAGRSVQRSG